jgi:GNAT superfamily N-acetyltransferase
VIRSAVGLAEPVATIIEVDPHDETVLRAFWEAEQAAVRADRAHPVIRTWDALRATVQDPSPYHRRLLLAALEDDSVVGGADVGMSLQDNRHTGDLEINVRPQWRRRGIGTALHAAASERLEACGRSTVMGEAYEPVEGEPTGAVPFARSLGFTSEHVEDHLVLPLPVAGEQVRTLTESLPDLEEYELVTWGDRCPDEHIAAYCQMHTQMETDISTGELDLEPVTFDEARVRTSETRLARSYRQLHVAARRVEDGVFGGFSIVLLPHGETVALQMDTLVMPEHRGRRLGLLMKLATLDAVRAGHPERTALHTWTARSNAAMQATNQRFGYVALEQMHEMQRREG